MKLQVSVVSFCVYITHGRLIKLGEGSLFLHSSDFVEIRGILTRDREVWPKV